MNSREIEGRLREARAEQRAHGHDWDIADIVPVVEAMVAEAGTALQPGSNSEWYVRSAINRGLLSLRHQIEDADRIIEKYEADETLAARGTVLEMTRNMRAYNKQMLQEMEQYIPAQLLLS